MPRSDSGFLQDAQPKSDDAAAEKQRVFIIDDHPIFRRGLVHLVEAEADLEVCGEAASAPEALALLRQTAADVVIVDVSLPGTNGIELLKHLRAEHPDLPLLVLSVHDEQLYALRALRAGASGYLMKREGEEKLLGALRKILEGQVYVSPAFGDQLIYKVARGAEGNSCTPLDSLTDRELEVLQLVGAGHGSREIAEALHLSVKTIESHRLHIKEKLGLKNAAELVRFAMDWAGQQMG